MMITGVDERIHKINKERLTDEKEIVESNVFPFRFLSAIEAIHVELEELNHRMDKNYMP